MDRTLCRACWLAEGVLERFPMAQHSDGKPCDECSKPIAPGGAYYTASKERVAEVRRELEARRGLAESDPACCLCNGRGSYEGAPGRLVSCMCWLSLKLRRQREQASA